MPFWPAAHMPKSTAITVIASEGKSAIIRPMRQLITRIDDQLHERLRARAAAEGRSVNSLVKELLDIALSGGDERARVAARIQAAGLQIVPRPERPPPSRDVAIAATRGAGQVATAALTADRTSR